MTFPAITAIAAGTLTILLMLLAFYTTMGRMKHRQSLGTGSSDDLEKRVRSHANLAEHAAIVLVCIGLIEMSGGDRRLVATLAAWLVAARLAHPFGLAGKPGPNPLRFFGSASTYAIGFLSGGWLIAIGMQRLGMGM